MLLTAGAACGDENSGPAAVEALRGHSNQREIDELTATSEGYNPVSRFLEALPVDPESAHT